MYTRTEIIREVVKGHIIDILKKEGQMNSDVERLIMKANHVEIISTKETIQFKLGLNDSEMITIGIF